MKKNNIEEKNRIKGSLFGFFVGDALGVPVEFIKREEFGILSMGHIPEVMEDHWFMYCDDISINYFRSWTGIQIFKGYYHIDQDF